MKKLLLITSVFLLIASCAKKDGGATGNYVVKIDGTKLTAEDVQAEMKSLPEMARQFFQGPDGTAKFVDELVKKEMLYLEAKKKGFDKDKETVKKFEEFKKITIINQLLEKEIAGAAKVTDADVKAYYEKNKTDFVINDQVRISQIVVKDEDAARKVYERIKSGEDFAKIAAAVSTETSSAKSGGDKGTFKKGEMSPDLEAAVFRLKKGDISDPVKMKDGIHIIKVTDAKGSVVPFDKVKGFVTQKMTSEKQKEAFDKFMENLKKSYKVEINKDALAKVGAASQPAPAQQPEQKKEPAPKK